MPNGRLSSSEYEALEQIAVLPSGAMRIQYYADTDSLYIDLAETEGADSREVAPGVVLDFDDAGRLVGIDIDQASTVVNWSHLELESLPLGSTAE